MKARYKINHQARNTYEFSRNTESWQNWQCCTTSNGNKLLTVFNLIYEKLMKARYKINHQTRNTYEFSRNTESWQNWQCCTTSNGNKLLTVLNLIRFKTFVIECLISVSILFSNLSNTIKQHGFFLIYENWLIVRYS